MNGALRFEFYSPNGTDQELVFVDVGFNGFGERVDFTEHERPFAHTFFVDIPRTGSDFDVMVVVYRLVWIEDQPVGTA